MPVCEQRRAAHGFPPYPLPQGHTVKCQGLGKLAFIFQYIDIA